MKITRTPEGLAYLNLWRDGAEYHRQKGERLREWTNVRFVAGPKRPLEGVLHMDLSREPFRFPDASFDAANCYHILEHLTPEEGERFIREVYRVLKPGAVYRVSVPDLEQICRDYLHHLEAAVADPSLSNMRRYRWSTMEIFEQMVRQKSGGKMMEAIHGGDFDREYIEERFSDIYRPLLAAGATASAPTPANGTDPGIARRAYRAFRKRLRGRDQDDWKHPAASKERVRWMYDRLSLRLLLEQAGFVDVEARPYNESAIPHWDRYDLDTSDLTGRPIDPSVYVEARKPLTGAGQDPAADDVGALGG